MEEALRHIAPAMHRGRYELAEKQSERPRLHLRAPARVDVRSSPSACFPFGLIALLHTPRSASCSTSTAPAAARTRLVVTGRAPRSVRRAFAELEAG